MLLTPSMISRLVSVKRLAHAAGSKSKDMKSLPLSAGLRGRFFLPGACIAGGGAQAESQSIDSRDNENRLHGGAAGETLP